MGTNDPERASDLPKATQHSCGERDGHSASVVLCTQHS